ncbi:MAG: tol-pal system-associated acyl-CoA thioesterase [Gammaproteobacteria bacterium]|nr:tol-pal system-associated acyl-CoA thioesterase [Gammaproteobacteria bacterium]
MSAFQWPARVYYEDTDAGGVVYYANYLRYLERARTEWFRAHGHNQLALATDPGVLFAVAEVSVRYRRPARLDDLLITSCVAARAGAASVVFGQQIRRGREDGELLAEATVRVVCVDANGFQPRRLPPQIIGDLQ